MTGSPKILDLKSCVPRAPGPRAQASPAKWTRGKKIDGLNKDTRNSKLFKHTTLPQCSEVAKGPFNTESNLLLYGMNCSQGKIKYSFYKTV